MTATVIETLNGRNRDFASYRHVSSLKMMPSMKTLIIGCVDPRVDPVDVVAPSLLRPAVDASASRRQAAGPTTEGPARHGMLRRRKEGS